MASFRCPQRDSFQKWAGGEVRISGQARLSPTFPLGYNEKALAQLLRCRHNSRRVPEPRRAYMNRFCRSDILRILHITPKQLSGWQRAGLAPVADEFSFYDLMQLMKVRDLRAKRVRPAVIRESLEAMQKQVAGMENPLIEASVFNVGSRLAFRHQGHAMEPLAGQFVMEFEPVGAVVSAKVRSIAPCETVADLFVRGVALEEHPSTHDEAIAIYQQVIAIEPDYAAAHINLGTLFYNRQNFVAAEEHYRLAIKADPRYALAYF